MTAEPIARNGPQNRRNMRENGKINRTPPAVLVTPNRRLTHSLDLTKEQAMQKPTRTCTIDGCERPHCARGWCSMHWQRWQKTGATSLPEPRNLARWQQCKAANCERQQGRTGARGYCSMHYKRLIKHGTVDIPERPKTLEEAFLRRITKGENGCWNWDGINKSGYGDLRFRGARMYAHRYAWERANGPIPDDMEVNHRCWNRACVNVEHLEVVTRSQNASYLDGPRVDNQSGYRNVSRNRNGWVARVNKNGVRYRGTTRKTIEGAIADAKHLREKLLGAHAGNG